MIGSSAIFWKSAAMLSRNLSAMSRGPNPTNALECQRWIAGFRRGGNLGRAGRALPAGHRQHLDAAGLAQRLHHRKRRRQNLDATLSEVARRLHDVAIGHPNDLQSHALEEAEQQKVRNAVGSCGVEFSWLRAGHRHELIN